ncbi:MAG TPA: lactate racemase domain-containing protein [Thermoleophilia bacterium]|nr:lactate racemase domain-containing protein [Thermoleophilia bacterium]
MKVDARSAAQRDDAWVFCGAGRLEVPGADAFVPPARLTPVDDPGRAVARALAEPVASRPLGELAREALGDARRRGAATPPGGAATTPWWTRTAAQPADGGTGRGARGGHGEIVLAVPDASRPCPTPLVVDRLLDELNAAGVPDARIAIAVGCGLHATTTETERRALVGERAAARIDVFDAQGIDGPVADLGITPGGAPVRVHHRVAAAALVIAVGVVEPHLYAGFSGGVKAVAIGCAGEETIAWTHRPAFIASPGVELGRLDGNPFQQTLRDVAARTPLAFAVNVVVDEQGRPVTLLAGDPVRVHESLAAAYRAAWLMPVDETFDVIIAGVPVPKSENLYQASRAATYIGLQGRPALAESGTIVLCADLPRGAGDGPGERNFAALLAGAEAPAELVLRGLREPLGPGGQRAFVVARVLERAQIAVVGARGIDAEALRAMGFEAPATVADARAAAEASLGRRPRVLAVADAVTTVVHRA